VIRISIIYRIFLILFVCCLALLTHKVEGMSVVVNKSVAIEKITSSQLRRIYSMRQVRWNENLPIAVFVLPSQSIIHQKFCKESLKIFPYQLDRIWNKLTFSGLGVAPTIVNSPQELLQAVKRTPGAIGYVDNIIKEEGIHVIEINK